MNKSRPQLPDFIIIGAMKCATTSLFQYISQHPNVSVSKVKEPNYFVSHASLGGNWSRGIAWYKSLFIDSETIKGEASTGYTKYPIINGVVAKLYGLLPSAKLIYIVCDPVERALSHYFHNVIREGERRSVSECFINNENGHYLNCSRYYLQINEYLGYFDASQILVIYTEDLKNNPVYTMKSVFDFIGLDATHDINYYFHNTFLEILNKKKKALNKDTSEFWMILEKLIKENRMLALKERLGSKVLSLFNLNNNIVSLMYDLLESDYKNFLSLPICFGGSKDYYLKN